MPSSSKVSVRLSLSIVRFNLSLSTEEAADQLGWMDGLHAFKIRHLMPAGRAGRDENIAL